MNRNIYLCVILSITTILHFSCGNTEKGITETQLVKYYPIDSVPDSHSLELFIFLDKGINRKIFEYDSVYIYKDSLIKIFTNIENGFSIKCTTKPNENKLILKTNTWRYDGFWKGY